MKEWLKSFLKSKENWQPIYFWVTMFLMLIYSLILYKVIQEKKVSDILVTSLIGLVIALITLYNIFKNHNGGSGGPMAPA